MINTQESKLILNYIIQILPKSLRSKFALWGHGRNFQADPGRGFAARWKSLWAIRCDWWFAYTEEARQIVESYGFPPELITVFNNAVDTTEIRHFADDIPKIELAALRTQFGIDTNKVAVYVGGLYDHKRISFLIEAAELVRLQIPSFELLIVGNGPDRILVERAAAMHSWIHYLGPRFGREKVAILKLGRIFAMPGLVGLSILDSAAAGLPIVTTAYPYHSPEIAYLQNGRNGLMVRNWKDPAAYAAALVSVLVDDGLHSKLAIGAREIAACYTMEAMADRFCHGVIAALSSPKL